MWAFKRKVLSDEMWQNLGIIYAGMQYASTLQIFLHKEVGSKKTSFL